jgi:DNA invertase Pin-like site-specific DNA recombinase
MTAKRAAIFARTSTADQAKDTKHSIPDQLRDTQAYAEGLGYEVVETFTEAGVSGTLEYLDRPEIARAIGLASAGKFDIIVWAYADREGRNSVEVGRIESALVAFGVGAHLVEGGERVRTTPDGVMVEGMRDLMAESEALRIKLRTGNGRYSMAVDGVFPGSQVTRGYTLADDRGSFDLDDEGAEVVRRAFALRLAGLSMPEVAAGLRAEGFTAPRGGPYNTSNTYRMMRHPIYRGDGYKLRVRSNPLDPKSVEEFVWAAPAIVSLEDYATATASKVGTMPGRIGQRVNPYPLRGRVYHSHGGELIAMHGETRSNGDRELHCRAGRTNQDTGLAPYCPGLGVTGYRKDDGEAIITTRAKADRIEAMALLFALDLAGNPSKLRHLQRLRDSKRATLAPSADRETIKDRIEELRGEYRSLAKLAASSGMASDFETDLAELMAARESAESELARLDDEVAEDDKVRAGIEAILTGNVYGLSDSPEMAQSDEETRLSPEWYEALRGSALDALTPFGGGHGRTNPLAPFAVEELRWLVQSLGLVIVLSENEGDGPRLYHEGEEVELAEIAGMLRGLKPARWPNLSIGLDTATYGLEDSATVRYGDSSSPLDQRRD